MGLIDDLNKAASAVKGDYTTDAISLVREAFGVGEEDTSYGGDLANVFNRIIDRIRREFVPVPLDADGKPVQLSEKYYDDDGDECMTLGFRYRGVVATVEGKDVGLIRAERLSKTPPDTQERIDEDKLKTTYDYWGCVSNPCKECPAVVDGRKPHERYGTSNNTIGCAVAQGYDLALRQAALDARA